MIRRAGVFLLLIVSALIIGACSGESPAPPYTTLPQPPLAQQVTPSCGGGLNHHLGDCLPHPKQTPQRLPFGVTNGTITGPDLSNNDPVYSSSAWSAIAQRNRFVYLKVNESTGYIDPTARAMTLVAKQAGLAVGGYDFLHVCGPNPASEADVFVRALRADGLTGPGTMPGAADAEYGGSGCDARAWLNAWRAEVLKQTGRRSIIYTGAWWWQPHMGAFWPADALSWISGYGVSYPYMPSGRSRLDIWQFSDHGFNGATTADLSIWRDGTAAFSGFISANPVPTRVHCYGPSAQNRNPVCVKAHKLVHSEVSARDATLRALDKLHCLYAGIASNQATALFHSERKTCSMFVGRATYFQRRIIANLY